MDLSVKNKVVLVTGGARGIGFASAAMLAAEGAKVALVDIDGDAAQQSASSLIDKGYSAVGIQTDITCAEAIQSMIKKTEESLGPIDILVHSAAVGDNKLFLESTPDDWKRMLGVCLMGPMMIIHAVLPGMVERNYGRVICLASDSARVGQARLSYYASAKAGVIGLIKSVAQEVGSQGVTLNVVSPGATNTELRQSREDSLKEQMGEENYARRTRKVVKMYPMGRIGEPEDIASAVSFLASERASWITGQVLSVNGGFIMP